LSIQSILQTMNQTNQLDSEGKEHGRYVICFDNGQLHRDFWYDHGLLHGSFKSWSYEGFKSEDGNWKHGKKHGLYKHYSIDGSLVSERYMSEGLMHGSSINYYSNGQKSNEGEWEHGKKHGKTRAYYPNGHKYEESEWKYGEKHGTTILYHENGQKHEESNWKHGKKDGKRTRWYADGKKQEETNWQNGEEHGEFKIWDIDNGNLIVNSYYVCGYPLSKINIVLRTLRKAKWLRLARLTKTREFNEWWYHPSNVGGIIAKKKLSLLLGCASLCEPRT